MGSTGMRVMTPLRSVVIPVDSLSAPASDKIGRRIVLDFQSSTLVIRFAFYIFIFSIPFELGHSERSIPVDVPTITGCVLLVAAIVHPHICFRRTPKALWCFLAYLIIGITSALTHGWTFQNELTKVSLQVLQPMLLFWVAYNLLRDERVSRGFLLTIVSACVVRAFLQLTGVAGITYRGAGRISALDQNPNTATLILAVGLLALIGLAARQYKGLLLHHLVRWPLAVILGMAILQMGSRGGLIALCVGFVALMFRGGTIGQKTRNITLTVIATGLLLLASFQSETLRARFELSLEGEMSGRENIFEMSWQMFLEEPLIGWGLYNNTYVLAYRLNYAGENRSTHNLALEALTATGIVGTALLFTGIWLCLRRGWKGRHNSQGILPSVLILTLLVGGLSGNPIAFKLFWLVLAYVLASGSPLKGKRFLDYSVATFRSAPLYKRS